MNQNDIFDRLHRCSETGNVPRLVLDFNGTVCTYRGSADYATLPMQTYMRNSLKGGWHRHQEIIGQVTIFLHNVVKNKIIHPRHIYILSTVSCIAEWEHEITMLTNADIVPRCFPAENVVGVGSNEMKIVWMQALMGDGPGNMLPFYIDDDPTVLRDMQEHGVVCFHASELHALPHQ